MNRHLGNGADRRWVIVNADDFGLSAGINAGIVEAHDHGIVTSASLMVRASAAAEASEMAKERRRLSVGLHVDLGEWMYREDGWHLIDFVVDVEDRQAVQDEVSRQLERFALLMGRPPTHLDSHQHVHRQEPAGSILKVEADRLDIPLRHLSAEVTYCGDFYGQTGSGHPLSEAITPAGLIRILQRVPPGITELSCHPGNDSNLNTMYRQERLHEVQALCAPEVRKAIDEMGIRLISFHDVHEESVTCRASCGER
jgi:chitin disaccharide deacetylase